MKNLLFTIALMVTMTSSSFAAFSFTIFNDNTFFQTCTYTVTCWTICNNQVPQVCCNAPIQKGGGCTPTIMTPGNTYTFTCNQGGSADWSTLSVTIKGGGGSCPKSMVFGDVSSADCRTGGNCNNCSSNYADCWYKISTGNYGIYPDFIARYANPDWKKNDNLISENIEKIMSGENNSIETSDGPVSFLENIPNPVSEIMKINFDLMEDAEVNVSVFDLSGKEVMNLKKGIMLKGSNSIDLNVSVLASGIYSYSFKGGDAVLTRKFNIVK